MARGVTASQTPASGHSSGRHSHLGGRVLLGIGAFLLPFILFLFVGIPSKTEGPLKMGVTFSQVYASSLGLDWRETLIASLDDLGIRQFRIPVYWNVVESQRGTFDWSTIDFQMDEIAKRDGKVLLAIGMKLPRWPECWMPDWAKELSQEDEHLARLIYLRAAVERYKTHPALESWQVENEVDFPFGVCPPFNRSFYLKELELVRTIDTSHPITTTDSGELATWLGKGTLVDALGISVYRVVRLPWGSKWTYDWLPTYFYHRHAILVSPWVPRIFVSEFQMEPWVEKAITETPLAEQFETFDVERMRLSFRYAEHMRLNEIYFWGVEWWYWIKMKHNISTFWDIARDFYTHHAAH